MTKTPLALVVLVALAAPAAAYHRQTPPVVQFTSSGDTPLPRVSAGGRRLALAIDSSGRQIFRLDRSRNLLEQLTTTGDNENPSISSSGSAIAWDSDCTQLGCQPGGRQIFMWLNGTTFQVTQDMSGSSINAALNGKGNRVAFQSHGNLAKNGNQTEQIFIRSNDGTITQMTQGSGTSQNPAYDRSGLNLVYESTSSSDGSDTGISQIWLVSPIGYPIVLTNGVGSSHRPAISPEGRVIAFESTADLTGDLHDTHVSQIFVYQTVTRAITQITTDSGGCTSASVSPMPGDWRVGFVCHGQGFFHHLLANQTYPLPISGGDTPQAIAELGGHFVMISTTDNVLGSGTTPGHQIYLLNLFKLLGF